MIVYDNNEREWKNRRGQLDRTNGAETYGGEILKWQVPIWESLSDDITISTTNLMSRIEDFEPSRVNVQYLHTFPKENPLWQYEKVSAAVDNVIFLTSYLALNEMAVDAGYNSVFIPMTIDASNIPRLSGDRQDKFIWYGNITDDKWLTYAKISRALGKRLDFISGGKLNGKGEKLTQEQCWDIIRGYKYGIGVGRCYMEMAAMGMKCIIAGAGIGGITTDRDEHDMQMWTNYNARYYTHSDDIIELINDIEDVVPQVATIDTHIGEIEERIREAYGRAVEEG